MELSNVEIDTLNQYGKHARCFVMTKDRATMQSLISKGYFKVWKWSMAQEGDLFVKRTADCKDLQAINKMMLSLTDNVLQGL